MSITKPIKASINGSRTTLSVLPQATITSSKEAAYGTVYIDLPWISTDSSSAQVYKVLEPTASEHRWIRDGSDIYSPRLLNYAVTAPSSKQRNLNWRFDPTDCTAQSGDHYSLEFSVNSIASKIILTVKDKIK